ncbi:hypothetical protein [Mycobacteroides abscessus]|uniref:hypothetical protein n=1 Tax=Mycobacteroides abscessus TaxID=36809 RepID=UPI001A993F06|nr:hypothetical protein [Mycobacteroides abscessus]
MSLVNLVTTPSVSGVEMVDVLTAGVVSGAFVAVQPATIATNSSEAKNLVSVTD